MTSPDQGDSRGGGIGTLEREAPGLVAPVGTTKAGGRKTRRRIIAIAVGLLLIFLVLVAVTTGQSSGGALDPRSAAPEGTRALAVLLQERGIEVQRGSAAGPGRTVLVPFPEALTTSDLTDLLSSGADVVLIDPGVIPAAQVTPSAGLVVRTRAPGCNLDVANVAGPVRLGGTAYSSGNASISCYDGALLTLPAGSGPGSGRITILGSSDFLTNDRLSQQGNAALAIGLLDRQPTLTWYTARRAATGKSLTDLLPKSVPWAVLQLLVALVVIGFWRGRRLGPVVTEPLPVVVRAAETVIGRARLYASARARSTAAEAIRTGSRARITSLLHLNSNGTNTDAQQLISAVALRTGREPGAVAALLYEGGGYDAGESDAALVRLAADLDKLENVVKEGPRR